MKDVILYISPWKIAIEKEIVKSSTFNSTGRDEFKIVRNFYDVPALFILGKLKNLFKTHFIDLSCDSEENMFIQKGKIFLWGMSESELIDRINSINPDIILIPSMFTAEQISVLYLAEVVKKYFKIPILVGGTHASIRPEWLIKDGNIDFIFIGDDISKLNDIIKSILIKDDTQFKKFINIPNNYNLVSKNNWEGYFTNNSNLFDFQFEFNKVLFNNNGFRYTVGKTIRNMIYLPGNTSLKRTGILYNARGCPYKCKFCGTSLREGARINTPRLEKAINIFETFYNKYDVKIFQNVADLFGYTKTDIEFLKYVRDKRIKDNDITIINTNGLHMRIFLPNRLNYQVDYETVDLFIDAGLNVFSLTVDTFNPKYNPKFPYNKIPFENIKELFKYIYNKGAKIDLYMIYAYPDQTYKELMEDINKVEKLKPFLATATWRMLNYFPGTTYYDWAIRNKKFTEEQYQKYILDGQSFYYINEYFNFSKIDIDTLKLLMNENMNYFVQLENPEVNHGK